MQRRRILMSAAAATLVALAVPLAGAQTRGVTANEIVVGTTQPLSGGLAAWGVPQANGQRMAVDEINAKGGIHGRKLRWIIEDNAYDPKLALQAAEKLVKRDNVFALVGNFGTSINVMLLPMLKDANVPNVFPQTADPIAWTPPDDLKWGYLYPNQDQARTAVKFFVKDRGRKNIGVLYQADEFGQGIYDGVVDQLKRMNMKLAGEATYKRGTTDMSSQIAKLRAAGVDAIVLGATINQTVSAAQEARKIGWKVDIAATSGGLAPQVHQFGGEAVEGMYGTSMIPIPYPDAGNEQMRAWMQRYKQAYKEEADLGAAFGYQQTMMFAEALKNAGPDLNTKTLAQGLLKIKNYNDFFEAVPYTYTPERRLGANAAFILQIQDGRWKKVSKPISPDE